MPSTSNGFEDLFRNWPEDMPRSGVVVTSFDEQIPFTGFLTSGELLLLQRQMPDALGARTVLLAYDRVTAVKIVQVVKPEVFRSIGFEGALPKA